MAIFEEKAWSYAKMKDMMRKAGYRFDSKTFLGWTQEEWNAVGDYLWYAVEEKSGPVPARCVMLPPRLRAMIEKDKAKALGRRGRKGRK